jgi:hypothetical protein
MNLKKYEIKDECKALLARIYSKIYVIYGKIRSCDQSTKAPKHQSTKAPKHQSTKAPKHPSTQAPNN